MKRFILVLAGFLAAGWTLPPHRAQAQAVLIGPVPAGPMDRRFAAVDIAARVDSLLVRLNDTWAVTRVDRQWLAGRLGNDTALLDGLLADSWTATELAAHGRVFGNAAETRAHYLADLQSGKRSYESIVEDETQVRVYGDSAVVSGRARSKGYLNDQFILGTSQFIRTYAKRLGRWQMIASTSTATLE